MGKPAARITDMHVCPMFDGPKPHVGGPIVGPGCPTVLIGGLPAAVMGDMCTCVGPPDTIVLGSAGVMIGGKPAARLGDQCAHGGKIVLGCMTVLVGEISSGTINALELAPVSSVMKVLNMLPNPITIKVVQLIAFEHAAKEGSMYVSQPKNRLESVKVLHSLEEKPIDKSEIHFSLVDIEGNPVEGENYKVVLPNGNVKTGKTGPKGEVEIKGFDPGECQISFPDIDAGDWD